MIGLWRIGVVVPPLIDVGLVKVIATVTVTALDFLLVAQIIALATFIGVPIAAIIQVIMKSEKDLL